MTNVNKIDFIELPVVTDLEEAKLIIQNKVLKFDCSINYQVF